MHDKLRGFEVVSSYIDKGIRLPERKTKHSAGYDIEAAEDITIGGNSSAVIPTGIKAYMQPDEYLAIHVRSGLSIKNRLSLLNGVGVIDSDYYGNRDNEGHIMVAIVNHSYTPIPIKKGERIAQGIFMKYLFTDNDNSTADRNGGIGSTGQ